MGDMHASSSYDMHASSSYDKVRKVRRTLMRRVKLIQNPGLAKGWLPQAKRPQAKLPQADLPQAKAGSPPTRAPSLPLRPGHRGDGARGGGGGGVDE